MRAGMVADRDPDRLLGLCEIGWAPALRGKVLVAEAEPESQADLLPAVAAAISRRGADVAAERWPACLLMAVVGTVAAGYRSGSAWATWWRGCGMRAPSAAGVASWERAFRSAALVFGLAEFSGLSGQEALLAHTGVPDRFLEELCATLVGGLDASASSPVALLFGLSDAAPFLSRCRDAMAAVQDESAAWDLVLPERFVNAIRMYRRDADASAGGCALTIEPFGRGPMLIGADGSEAPAVVPTAGGRLFVFGEDDTAIPEDAVLPPTTVWLLHPAGSPPVVAGTLRVVAQGSLPLQWSGWSLVEADLEAVAWLRAGESGSPRRMVGGRAKPVLVTGAPLAGLVHGTGRPVFAGPPMLRLPVGAADWDVEVRDRDAEVWIRKAIRGLDEAAVETTAFWDELPRPLLGEYIVRVRGGGPGMVRRVVLAEGLAVECFPAVRLLAEEGLETAEAVLHPGRGMTSVPAALTFGPDCACMPVELVAGNRRERFVVTPPRIRVGVEGGAPEADVVRPPRLERAELARGGRLLVTLPGAARSPVLDVVAGGCVVQTVNPHRDGGYNLRRVLDTVTAHAETVLRLTHDGRSATVAWIVNSPLPEDPWLPRTAGSTEG